MKVGLRQSLGRQALYMSLLRKFCERQRDFPARLAGALEAEDWQTAERLAHTLKGVCAQVGAKSLAAIAERLEQRKICTSLAAELAADDFASCATFDGHEPLMRAALGDRYAAISAAIHDFNFPLAMDQLRDAVAEHGIKL